MKFFYLKQKAFSWTDRYKVYDKYSNVKYYVEGELFSWRGTMKLFSIDGVHLFTFKHHLFSFFRTLDITNVKTGMVTTVRKNFAFFSTSLTAHDSSQHYVLDGKFTAHDFKIFTKNKLTASIHKHWLTWGDAYEISIDENADEPLMIALIIGIDTLIHNDRYNN